MKGKILKTLVLVGILTLVVGAGQAMAQGTLTVTATVSKHCQVDSTSLAFGAYSPFDATPVVAEADFDVRCTRHASDLPVVQLGNGANYSGGRRMTGGGEYLNYFLYSDSARLLPWDTTNTVTIPSPSMAGSTLTVYGRIPAGQDIIAADYSDSVIISVNF